MLIIFDCDGVLVDSEQLAAEVFSQVLTLVDVELSPEKCFETFHGRTLEACYRCLEEQYQIKLPSNFDEMIDVQTQRRFSEDLQPVAGITDVLDALRKRNIKYCLASNGGHRKIENSLTTTKLLPYFPMRFSASDVNCGKSAPDLFLYAADRMAELPTHTVVIEDSASGYQAALAANMQVMMYTPSRQEHNSDTNEKNSSGDFPQAQCFSSMSDLLGLLPL